MVGPLEGKHPMAKREINAKDFMSDVQAGMDDVGLMRKYRLTPKGLDSTFRKLLTVGLISRFELEARRIGQEETVDLSGIHTALVERNEVRRSQRKTIQYLYSGKVEGVDILDYVQWMLIEGRQTMLEVRALNGMTYRLFIDDGKVLHAACTEMEGEEAFYSCVRSAGGEFDHLPWSDPEKITIEKAGMQLLFEGARRRDEASRLSD
jgi:hypothetical protein